MKIQNVTIIQIQGLEINELGTMELCEAKIKEYVAKGFEYDAESQVLIQEAA